MKQEKQTIESEFDISKSFAEHLRELLKQSKGLSGKELQKALKQNARNEEEKKGMEDVFHDNELFNLKAQELRDSGLSAEDWFENEVEQMAKDLFADEKTGEVSEEKINEVKKGVQDAMHLELKGIAEAINRQMDDLEEIQKQMDYNVENDLKQTDQHEKELSL